MLPSITINQLNEYQTQTMDIKELPKELQDYIGEFNWEHRVYMKEVLNQLKSHHEFKYKCDNWDCESKCYDNEFIRKSILFQEHRFCCEECEGIGESDIRYYYRRQS